MKITLPKHTIESALTNCQNFLDKKDRSQITSHIYFEAKDDRFIMKATDYEIWLESYIDCPTQEQGNATTNGKEILDVIKRFKDGNINIEFKDEKIHISQGKTRVRLLTFNADEFPRFPEYDENQKINIQPSEFLQSIRKINPAVDTNSTKYELNGSLLDIKDYGFNFVATDTRRLAVIEFKSQSIDTLGLIIPKKAIVEIQKLFMDNVEIYYSKTHLIIKSPEYTFYTKLISGKYPDYEKIIPREFKYKLNLPKDEFIHSLQLVKSIKTNNTRIKITSNEILFSSFNEEGSDAIEPLEILTNVKEDITIGVNSRYILDFLTQIDTQDFMLCINEPNTPFVLTSENFLTVIMPVIL